MSLEKVLNTMNKNKTKIFVVTSNILLSGLTSYKTLDYASENKFKEAIFIGACSLIFAYVAGYHTKR